MTEFGAKDKILVILHHADSSPGRVGRLLIEQGAELDIRRPALGQDLPRTMKHHAGCVFFGGAMSCNDGDDFIKREIDFIGEPLREGKPFLGICLGGQMLARHLGAKVAPHPRGLTELGYYPIRPTPASERALGGSMPKCVYQWHSEGFEAPRGATLLAEGDDFPNQAFSYGANAYALQFHPEVTYAMMCRWTVKAYERMHTPGAQPPEAHLSGWYANDRPVDIWLRRFLSQWRCAKAVCASVPMRSVASVTSRNYAVAAAS